MTLVVRLVAVCLLGLQLTSCVERSVAEVPSPPIRSSVTVVPSGSAEAPSIPLLTPSLGMDHPLFESRTAPPAPRVEPRNVVVGVVFALAITLALVWFSGSSGNPGGQCPPIC